MSSFSADILAPKKLQSQTVTREKLCKTLLNEKFSSKMLMKMTHGWGNLARTLVMQKMRKSSIKVKF
jgi:hypothetical protein